MPLREQLERLVDDMVTRGVRYEDAQREFEKRFLARVLRDADGNLGKAADLLGMHRNTLSRKIADTACGGAPPRLDTRFNPPLQLAVDAGECQSPPAIARGS